MPLDLEEEVPAAPVTGSRHTVTTASELHNLCAFIRGHFIGGLDSGRSCHCSGAGPPGSGPCRVYHHLVPAEVRWNPIIIETASGLHMQRSTFREKVN